jgi:hypothetical protein
MQSLLQEGHHVLLPFICLLQTRMQLADLGLRVLHTEPCVKDFSTLHFLSEFMAPVRDVKRVSGSLTTPSKTVIADINNLSKIDQ